MSSRGSARVCPGSGRGEFVRFVWAVAAFVLAALMIVAGIAQRTIFQGPSTETASISTKQEAPYLLIHGAVLNQLPGAQTLRAQADGDIFAAYGRDRKSTRLNSSHVEISYAVFC